MMLDKTHNKDEVTEMLLSIGMIVKNEEKNLRRCLESIKPILDNIVSELIIADTGSTDNTIEIAKEFTKNVFSINWRNDFAAARNTTISRAKGKWYMFLDADEFFVKTDDLIEFFNSGEYKEYKSATHIIKNIVNSKGQHGSSFSAGRLCRLEKDTVFTGKIHESLPNNKPQKTLQSISEHIGYDFTGEEGKVVKAIKYERNIHPLLKEFEKNPKDARTIAHIIREYKTHEKNDEMKRYIDIGLSLFTNDSLSVYYHIFCKYKIMYYNIIEQHENVIVEARNYFQTTQKLFMCAVDMRYYEATANKALKQEAEYIEALLESYKLIKDCENGTISNEYLAHDTNSSSTPEFKLNVAKEILLFYLNNSLFDEAVKWAADEGYLKLLVYSIFILDSADKKNYDNFAEFYKYVVKCDGFQSSEYSLVIEAIETRALSKETKFGISRVLGGSDIDDTGDDYLKLQKLRYLDYTDNTGVYSLLEYFINAETVFSPVFADVFAIAMKHNIDFTPFVDRLKVDDIPLYADKMSGVNEDFAGVVVEFVKNSVWYRECCSIKCGCLMYALTNQLLNKCPDNVVSEKIGIFELYVRECYKHLSRVYSADVFDDEMVDILAPSGRFVYYAYNAYVRRSAGDMLGFVSGLNAALSKDTSMKEIVRMVITKFQEDEGFGNSKKADAPLSPEEQLQREVAELKAVVEQLIKKGNYSKAGKILESYKQINPSDADIEKLESKLKSAAASE